VLPAVTLLFLSFSLLLCTALTKTVRLLQLTTVTRLIPPNPNPNPNPPGLKDGLATSRPAVLGALCLFVLIPLGGLRAMDRLAVVNITGVASNALFALLTAALAGGALSQGIASAVPLWPQWGAMVAVAGGSKWAAGMTLASTLPVILNCFSCHQVGY